MRSNKKIVHMTTVHHPFDPRIYHKECLSIQEAGYDVTLLAQKDPNTGELSEEITHIPLKTYEGKLKRMLLCTMASLQNRKAIKSRCLPLS